MEVNKKTFVPVAFTESEALAAFASVRMIFAGVPTGERDSEEAKSVAQAMVRLGEAIDKARAERVESKFEDVLRDAFEEEQK